MKLTDAERAKVDTIRARLDNHDLRFDMYLYAGKHGLERHPAVDDLRAALAIIDRLSQEPEVVQSEWINIEPCTNDAVEYADFIAYLARTEMNIVSWECKNCGSIDMGAPTRKPCHCRGCGALMRNGDFDKSKPNDGKRKEGT
jgi:hypothetical protein